MFNETFHSHSESETIEIAKSFCERLTNNDTVALIGDLGAGKTLFIKSICEFFDVDEIVTSPTFTLINKYIGKFNGEEFEIYHIDLYRINKQEELIDLGFFDLINTQNSLKLIEWAERVLDFLPLPYYVVNFSNVENQENERIITITYRN